jgi:serine/threonine protein kinase
MELPISTIDPKDVSVGGFLGDGASAKVNEGIYLPTNYPVAIKIVNVLDKEKRAQLLNDLRLLTFNPHEQGKICENLVQLYGAYFEDGSIRLILELMDVGSFRDILNMRKAVLGSAKVEERIISLTIRQVDRAQ